MVSGRKEDPLPKGIAVHGTQPGARADPRGLVLKPPRPPDHAGFESAYSVTASWSPGSKRVIYTRHHITSRNKVRSDLWIAQADGRPGKRLTFTPEIEWYPNWATDPDTAENG